MDFDEYAKINGEDAISIEIFLRDGANALDTKTAINESLSKINIKLPPNLEIVITDDETVITEQLVSETQGNILAVVLLIIILVVSFNWIESWSTCWSFNSFLFFIYLYRTKWCKS